MWKKYDNFSRVFEVAANQPRHITRLSRHSDERTAKLSCTILKQTSFVG